MPHQLSRMPVHWMCRAAVPTAFASLALAGVMVFAQPAQASFPGANGRIVYVLSSGEGFGPGSDFCAEEPCSATELEAVNPRTRRSVRFNPRCSRECEQHAPAFSPDGLRVAFEEFFHPKTPDGSASTTIAVTDAAGAEVREVLDDADSPAWSPTGKALAVVTFGAGIRVIRPDGSDVRQVTRRPGSDLDWSVRNRIVFSYRGSRGRRNLYVVRSDGRRLRRLTHNSLSFDPSWSPDGRRIAFVKETPRDTYALGIYTMRANGTRLRRIARGAGSPVWSPNGKRIAYSRGTRIVTADPDGSRRRVVYRVPRTVDAGVGELAWQPAARATVSRTGFSRSQTRSGP